MDDHRRTHSRPWDLTPLWWVPLIVAAAVAAVALGPIVAEAS